MCMVLCGCRARHERRVGPGPAAWARLAWHSWPRLPPKLYPKMLLREYVKVMTEGGFIVSEGLVCEALAYMKLTLKKVRCGRCGAPFIAPRVRITHSCAPLPPSAAR